jgi:hypothetical protein
MVATIFVERMGRSGTYLRTAEMLVKNDQAAAAHENPALSERVARCSVDAFGLGGFDWRRPSTGLVLYELALAAGRVPDRLQRPRFALRSGHRPVGHRGTASV